MAWVYHDGRILLIGGKGTHGNLDTIIHARISIGLEGKTGHWYTSPQTLPSPRSGLAAAVLSDVFSDKLYIAGGWDISGILGEVVSCTIGAYGALTPLAAETPLPVPLELPVLIPNNGELLVAGGLDDTGHYSDSYFQYRNGMWAEMEGSVPESVFIEGPTYGAAAGHLITLAPNQTLPLTDDSAAEQSVVIKDMGLAPAIPLLSPGSGRVRSRTKTSMIPEPGTSIHYILDPEDGEIPGPDDPVWDFASPLSISADTALLFSSISEITGSRSPVVRREYRVRDGVFILDISGTLYPRPADTEELLPFALEVPLSPPSPPMPVSSAWYRILVTGTKQVSITWADGDDDEAYTARASFTLFEEDFYTSALGVDGYPVSSHPALTPATADPGLPRTVCLSPGTYYLSIEDLDGLSGRSVGFLIKEYP